MEEENKENIENRVITTKKAVVAAKKPQQTSYVLKPFAVGTLTDILSFFFFLFLILFILFGIFY